MMTASLKENEIRVIAVRQPWASLIVEGLKTIEVRSRPTNIRERVAIYGAGHNLTNVEYDNFVILFHRLMVCGLLSYSDFEITSKCLNESCTRNRILGTVEIVGCEKLTSDEIEHFALDINPNSYSWKLANPIKFDKPIRYDPPKGAIVWSKTVLPGGY
jgi:hypothetical protein